MNILLFCLNDALYAEVHAVTSFDILGCLNPLTVLQTNTDYHLLYHRQLHIAFHLKSISMMQSFLKKNVQFHKILPQLIGSDQAGGKLFKSVNRFNALETVPATGMLRLLCLFAEARKTRMTGELLS